MSYIIKPTPFVNCIQQSISPQENVLAINYNVQTRDMTVNVRRYLGSLADGTPLLDVNGKPYPLKSGRFFKLDTALFELEGHLT